MILLAIHSETIIRRSTSIPLKLLRINITALMNTDTPVHLRLSESVKRANTMELGPCGLGGLGRLGGLVRLRDDLQKTQYISTLSLHNALMMDKTGWNAIGMSNHSRVSKTRHIDDHTPCINIQRLTSPLNLVLFRDEINALHD